MFYPSIKEHVLMFSCLIPASNPHVLMFSCLTPRKQSPCSSVLLSYPRKQSPCSHVLLSSPKNMFFCLITMHIFLIPIKILNCFSLPFQISFILLYINILSLSARWRTVYTRFTVMVQVHCKLAFRDVVGCNSLIYILLHVVR